MAMACHWALGEPNCLATAYQVATLALMNRGCWIHPAIVRCDQKYSIFRWVLQDRALEAQASRVCRTLTHCPMMPLPALQLSWPQSTPMLWL